MPWRARLIGLGHWSGQGHAIRVVTESRRSLSPAELEEPADDEARDMLLKARLARTGRKRMKRMDLLADTRQCLSDAIRQLAAIEAGAPIARPLSREDAINIVAERIGLCERLLRRYERGMRDAGHNRRRKGDDMVAERIEPGLE